MTGRELPATVRQPSDAQGGCAGAPARESGYKKYALCKRVLLAAVCAGSLWVAFSGAEILSRSDASVSVRWVSARAGAQTVSLAQAEAASERLSEHSQSTAEPARALTFWSERQGRVTSDNRSVDAVIIAALGDVSRCFPLQMESGGWPVAGDRSGCVVSRQLAWLLWGNESVIGLHLQAAGQTYTVRGILRGDEPLLLCAASDTSAFTAVDISNVAFGDGDAALARLLQTAGLPPARQISHVAHRAALARLLCALPLVAAAFCALARGWILLWRRAMHQRGILLFATALAGALLLPFLFAHMPPWMIPARWSDGTFWSGLWQILCTEVRGTLALVPFTADVLARELFLQTVVSAFLSLWCVLSLRK